MKKINVLHILNTTDIGGTERVLLDMCKYYDRDNFKFVVAVFEKGQLENEFRKHVKMVNLNDPRHFSCESLKRILKIVKEEHIDIVQTHLQRPEFYGFLVKLRHPTVKWAVKKGNTNKYRKKLFWRMSNGFILKFASTIVTTSRVVRDFTAEFEFVRKKKMLVIYSGIDLQRIGHKIRSGANLRKRLELKKTDKVVISVGRLVYQKGFEYLIGAMNEFDKDFKLLIAGDGDLKDKLREQIGVLGLESRVKLLGERKDVKQLLSISDVFCLASIEEGLGLVVMEAMAAGVPVVATNVGGLKEVVGDAGILVEPRKPDKLASAIKDAMRKRAVLTKRAYKQVGKFSVENTVKEYEKLYKRMV